MAGRVITVQTNRDIEREKASVADTRFAIQTLDEWYQSKQIRDRFGSFDRYAAHMCEAASQPKCTTPTRNGAAGADQSGHRPRLQYKTHKPSAQPHQASAGGNQRLVHKDTEHMSKQLTSQEKFHVQVAEDFYNSQEIQAEFGSLGAYKGWRQVEANNKGRICASAKNSKKEILTDEDRAGDQTLPLENRVQNAWRASSSIRSEFGGNFDSYLAYRRAVARGAIKG